jgi:arsenate reductase (glutaredoxin)
MYLKRTDMIQILHNPRCSKSREVFNYLKEKGIQVKEINYMSESLSAQELKEILSKLGVKPLDWVRKNEELYKKEFKGKEMTDSQWIDVLAENPRLIERPVVINGNKAVIGRPLEKIMEIL